MLGTGADSPHSQVLVEVSEPLCRCSAHKGSLLLGQFCIFSGQLVGTLCRWIVVQVVSGANG